MVAKKPIQSLEYDIAQEIFHFLVRDHNDRFMAYLDKFYYNGVFMEKN